MMRNNNVKNYESKFEIKMNLDLKIEASKMSFGDKEIEVLPIVSRFAWNCHIL